MERAVFNFLRKIVEEGHEMHSFVLMKDGERVCEKYWKPFSAECRHQLFSLSKSFTAIAIGIAVDEKLLTTSTLLADIFVDEFEQIGERMNDKVRKMSIKHLLTMATGMEYEAWSGENRIIAFLSAHLKDTPGEIFRYSSVATYMLSAAITRLTGDSLTEYLVPRLFEPLGIKDYYWRSDSYRHLGRSVDFGGFGLNLTTDSIAKFGQFLLQKGEWNGRQLVSAEWIEEATAKQIDNSSKTDKTSDWAMGYGYQFWRCKYEGVYRGDGMYGQYCVVYPAENIVIAATSNADMGRVLGLFWELLDDLKLKEAEKLADGERLADFDNLSHLVVEKSDKYPDCTVEYRVVSELSSPEDFAYWTFDFRGGECVMEIYNLRSWENGLKSSVASLLFEERKWLKYAAPHFVAAEKERDKISRVATYGIWNEAERTFTMTTWFYESATKDQFRVTFSQNYAELVVERRGGGFAEEFREICRGARL
ncbi:MAG: beta-lactamase family protein [Turicibacter sp.]|nr:beta-lactamase family protein [Turicibacter sp.]